MESAALTSRFISTSRSGAGSPAAAPMTPASTATSMRLPRSWASSCHRGRVSSTTSCTSWLRSTATASETGCTRLKRCTRRTTSAPSWAARWMISSERRTLASCTFPISSSIRPRMTAKRLFRWWAMPEAS